MFDELYLMPSKWRWKRADVHQHVAKVLRIGYGRAGRIVDEMERRGLISRVKAQNQGERSFQGSSTTRWWRITTPLALLRF